MSSERQAWFGIRWLQAVRTHPDRTRYAVIAANALAPWTDNTTGRAFVPLESMSKDQCQPIRALRRGFDELEAIGLLTRERQRKPGSQEWDVTIYHPRLATRPEQGQGAKPTGGDRSQNYSGDSGLRVEKGSKRPLDGETSETGKEFAERLYESLKKDFGIDE